MLSRIWHGWTSRENADAYETLLRTKILPDIQRRGISGYRGVYLYRRPVGERVEFVTTMFFDSLDAVKEFAGDDYTHGVVPPAAKALLDTFDATSAHYDVLLAPGDVRP